MMRSVSENKIRIFDFELIVVQNRRERGKQAEN